MAAGGAAPPEGAMSNGVYALPSAANGEVKPVVSSTPLVDFLMQLEDYTPTVGFPPVQGHLPRCRAFQPHLHAFKRPLLGSCLFILPPHPAHQ